MKTLILFLAIASIGIAEAKVYKCSSEIEGRYSYQQKPCDDNPDENVLKIRTVSEDKVNAAKEKFAQELETHKAKVKVPEKIANDVKKIPLPKKTETEKKSRGRWTDRH